MSLSAISCSICCCFSFSASCRAVVPEILRLYRDDVSVNYEEDHRSSRLMSEENTTTNWLGFRSVMGFHVSPGLCDWAWHWRKMQQSSSCWWRKNWGSVLVRMGWPPFFEPLFSLWLALWMESQCVWLCVLEQTIHTWVGTGNIWERTLKPWVTNTHHCQ